MDIGNIQIGIDIATAISVVIATHTFFWGNIRENKKNREAEQNEQKKTRSLRISEYKIEKVTEIIYYLNEKIHKLVEINNEVDTRIQLKVESNKIRISAGEKKEISYLLRKK
jgi:C4-dicarboxylate transporter